MLTSFKKFVSKLFMTLTLGFHTPVRIRRFTHILLFLFSLLLSIAFWCFVSYDSEVKAVKTLSVPIRYVGLSSGLDKKVTVDTARVRVSGREKYLLGVSANDLDAVVDLKGEGAGVCTKDIKVTSSSGKVTVSNVYPAHIRVTIYRRLKRVLPVNVTFAGNDANKNISDVIITPPQIAVSGKAEAVRSVSSLNVLLDTEKLDEKGNITLPIIIKGIAEDIVDNTELTLSQKDVVAHVVFDDEIISRELPLKLSLVGHPQNKLIVAKSLLLPATVMVRAKASFFKNIKEINLGKVDISNVRGTTSMRVPFVVPKEFKNPSYEVQFDAPGEVRLNLICKEVSVKKLFENVPIKLVGDNDLGWTLSTRTATVSVEALASTLTTLNGEIPFEIFVDTTDIVRKKITLPVSFKSKKNGVKLISIEPSIVTITHE